MLADYGSLALHNQQLAEARHMRTNRERVRNALLRAVAAAPIPAGRSDGRTILLIRPDHLGDVLLTTPAIQALAHALPDARLVALVGPWSAGIISVYPEIDLTLTIPFPGFSRHPVRTSPQPYLAAWQWATKLRQLQASSAIIFRPDHWWGGMLARLAGIPQRIGFNTPDLAPFLTRSYPLDNRHAVEHNMALVSSWVRQPTVNPAPLTFPVAEEDRKRVHHLLNEAGLPSGSPRIIIHPGAGTQIKQWPPAHWARVADRLAATWGAPIIFTGTDHEIPLVQSIRGMMAAPGISLAGETNVYQLAALYEGARVVLGPDSGPLHLATAVQTPTVHLFGPADPVEFGPWGDPQRHAVLTTDIACRPCRIIDWPNATPAEHPCVRDIDPDDVIAAALRVAANS